MMSLEMGGLRLFLCLGCLVLLKFCESWILSSNLDAITNTDIKLTEPLVSHPRCDACRFIGIVIDSNLRSADEKLEGEEELTLDEVEAIADDICSKQMYRHVELVHWEEALRLSFPHLETFERGVRIDTEQDWMEKVSSHCRYLLDKMRGIELYDLWLRAGHRDTKAWIEFLCEGEGVFGDCTQEKDGEEWPWESHRNTHQTKKSEGPLDDRMVTLDEKMKDF